MNWINVTGKKFDDPNAQADQSVRKMYPAFPWEEMRRALQGITNCVLQGTAGTGAFVTAGIAAGSTTGVQVANPIDVCIDGIKYALAAQNNIPIDPASGTQGTNTVAKYLVYAGTNGSAYCTQGNVVDKGDVIKNYKSDAAANADAKLPDLPDNCVALGYFQINAPTAAAVNHRVGALGTMGTIAYQDFIHMPMNT